MKKLIITCVLLSITFLAYAHTQGEYPPHSEETLQCMQEKCVDILERGGGNYWNGGVRGQTYVNCYIRSCDCIIEYLTGDLHCGENKIGIMPAATIERN